MGLQVDVPNEMLDILFGAGLTSDLEEETPTLKVGDSKTNLDVISSTYAVTEQECVVETLNKLVNDSFTYFPRQNN